jgi:hypothetical protein
MSAGETIKLSPPSISTWGFAIPYGVNPHSIKMGDKNNGRFRKKISINFYERKLLL